MFFIRKVQHELIMRMSCLSVLQFTHLSERVICEATQDIFISFVIGVYSETD